MFALETLLMLMTTCQSVAKIIDLSHNHDANTFMSVGSPPLNHTILYNGEFLPGIFLEYGALFTGEHGGTHIDAPRHFYESGKYLHEIPLERTILTGVMIDCSEEVKGNPGYVMPLQKLLDWENNHGKIPDGAAVIVNFGWSDRFNDRNRYIGTSGGKSLDDLGSMTYPTLSKESGEWLATKRNVLLLGTDTMAVDLRKDKYPIHVLFLSTDRLLVENVRDPSRLPPRGFRLHAAPVKFVGASGAQIRLYAMTFDEDGGPNNARMFSPLNILIMITLCFFMAQFI